MSESCAHDCAQCAQNCASREQASLLAQPHPNSQIQRVVGVVSGKGGVGKSLVTSLLAVLTRRQNLKAAILDADITGPSIPRAFGLSQRAAGDDTGIYPVASKTGIQTMSLNLLLEGDTEPVVWRGPVIAGTVKQFWTDVVWGDVDMMFIDMPPGTGDVPLTVYQSIPMDGIVVVASPQELVGMIVEKAINMAKLMNIPVLGLVENMSYIQCPDCAKRIYPFGESRAQALAAEHRIPIVARIPIEPKLAAACDRGMIELFEGDWLDELAVSLLKGL